jgi:molybdate transport system substrate-binding protein
MLHLVVACLFAVALPAVSKADVVRLHAAGSLKAALTDVVRAFEARTPGARVEAQFAASGLLRERIEKGELAHVFASADTGNPGKLVETGRARGPIAIFARNQLCALARQGLSITSATLLDIMLNPSIRLGTSTPKADPSGDYAFILFAKAEKLKPGATAVLEARALQLTGGPTSEKAPAGRNQYAWVMETGRADVFLTYCTNAVLARKEVSSLQMINVPAELNVAAEYGLVVLDRSPPIAQDLASFILGEEGQAILVEHGFGRGDVVQR